jgi:hypothetical protein
MQVTIQCQCGQPLQVDTNLVGLSVRCVNCGRPVPIPPADAPASARAAPRTTVPTAAGWMFIALAGACLLAIILALSGLAFAQHAERRIAMFALGGGGLVVVLLLAGVIGSLFKVKLFRD